MTNTQKNHSNQYLEAFKSEEFASTLQRNGYEVEREKQIGAHRFDIVARKGTEALAYETVVNSELGRKSAQIQAMRQEARAHGYQFSIFVVAPPLPTQIEFEGLEAAIIQAAKRENIAAPEEAVGFSQMRAVVAHIFHLQTRAGKTTIHGEAVIEWSDEEGPMMDLPFEFNLEFDRDGQLSEVKYLGVELEPVS